MSVRSSETTPPLRGGIVGFGNVAVHAHLPALEGSGRFRVEAVVEPSPERASLVETYLPGIEVYPHLDALLSKRRLDFVDICTPPCFHTDLILRSCRSGAHVLCEKPLTASPEELTAIGHAAESSGRVVHVVNNWKHAPLWAKVLEVVRKGEVGKLMSVSLSVERTPKSGGGASDWRRCPRTAGGGILLDHGWHHFYLILSMLGEDPLSISARMTPHPEGNTAEETADVVMKFKEAEARLYLTWRAECRRNIGEVRGTKGRLFIRDDHLILERNGEGSERYDFSEPLSGGSHHPFWMGPVIEEFSAEIEGRNGRGNNFAETVSCSRLADLAYRSQKEGSCLMRF